ncbi:MAG: sialidase family protein [Kiritimatiellia bacterium]
MHKIIETKAICKQPRKYIGWPTVARAPDGTVYAVFSGDRDAHVCPFGKSYIMSSKDGGISWSEPRVVNDTPLDDRDTGLCVLPDGTLVITWFTSYYYRAYEVNWAGYSQSGKYTKKVLPWAEWEKELKAITPDDLDIWAPFITCPAPEESEKWAKAWADLGCESSVAYDPRFPAPTRRFGYWTRRSHDGGQTWDRPTLSPASAPHGPNVLPDGKLIYAGIDLAWSGNIGVAVSPDRGLSWKTLAALKARVGRKDGIDARLCEPHVVCAPSGKLVGLARYQAALPGEERFLWQFDSEDGGATWSEPRPTPLNGYPPHLLRVSDGRLLASFGVRHEPLGNRFCFSSDEGRTWDVAGQLHVGGAPDKDLGYPATAEMAPGSFLSVYYRKDHADEKPCLMMTRWCED